MQTRPPRRRLRELGILPGIFPTGRWNAITDLSGVRVGHVTLKEGADIRTGVTAILPHPGNLHQEKLPAGIAIGNGFGKLAGFTQVDELGEIETPILLTNTLAVPRAAEALIEWTLDQDPEAEIQSINPLVGETNDGMLNNIRKMAVEKEHARLALANAASGPVAEGCVGAGTGTVCFGWKGGIGTSSRLLPEDQGGYTLGVLVQTNFGGVLHLNGAPVQSPDSPSTGPAGDGPSDGSIMVVLGVDAPLSDRNLKRLAHRAMAGLARTGASMSNGSGDYAIAFSTAESVRRTPARRSSVWAYPELPNAMTSGLFQAAIEAVEEAIYNSLCMAETTTGYRGRTVHALPLEYFLQQHP